MPRPNNIKRLIRSLKIKVKNISDPTTREALELLLKLLEADLRST